MPFSTYMEKKRRRNKRIDEALSILILIALWAIFLYIGATGVTV